MHDEPEPSNTMTPQTHAAILVGPTDNLQGTQKFWFLKTRKILKHRSFTKILMPDRVILQVNPAVINVKREQYDARLKFKNRKKEDDSVS